MNAELNTDCHRGLGENFLATASETFEKKKKQFVSEKF